MTTYTWQFPALDVYPNYQGLSNVVFQVHWKLTADDGAGHKATTYGSQMIGRADVDSYTLYSNLTANTVQGWVEQAMGTAEVNAIKAELDAKIAQQVSPTKVTMAPPW